MTLPLDEAPQTIAVHVTNRNRFLVKDRFDGREYAFAPDVKVQVPIDAANHIFGWFPEWTDEEGRKHNPDPVLMRRHVQRRWGWNTPNMADKADLFYDNIDIKPITYRMVPVEDEDKETMPVKAAIEKRRTRMDAAIDDAIARGAAG